MKRLFSILFLLACFSVKAQTIITATVTVTNTAVNGNTISVNGVVRTWTNTITAANSQIATTNSVGGTLTNMWYAYAATPNASVNIFKSATNVLLFTGFPGAAMTVSFGGTWATVVYSPNTITNATVIRAPRSVEGVTQQAAAQKAIVDYLNNATNIISPTAPAFIGFSTSSNSYTGFVRCASNALTVTVSGLALPFTPKIAGAWMGGSNSFAIIGVQTEMNTITTNGATFDLDTPTDSTNYFLQYLFE